MDRKDFLDAERKRFSELLHVLNPFELLEFRKFVKKAFDHCDHHDHSLSSDQYSKLSLSSNSLSNYDASSAFSSPDSSPVRSIGGSMSGQSRPRPSAHVSTQTSVLDNPNMLAVPSLPSTLNKVIREIRQTLPYSGCPSSDKLMWPSWGNWPELCPQETTVLVDSFLWADAEVKEMHQQGEIPDVYCASCGSTDIKPFSVLSLSLSIADYYFLFSRALPDLSGKIVIDISSRFGACLFAGHAFSRAARLVGIERSQELFQLCQKTIFRNRLDDRCEVIFGNAMDESFHALLSVADVVLWNHAWTFQLSPQDQVTAWKTLRKCMRKRGALLVTVPDLQQALYDVRATESVNCEEWVKELPLDRPRIASEVDSAGMQLCDMHVYQVL